jgi:RNA polymerase sigma-70 factor (ECF subfamily)
MTAQPATAPPTRLDPLASARLYESHAPFVRRYLRTLGAGSDLEDLLQSTFLVLLQRPFVERGDAPTAAFLRTTARQLFLQRHRQLLPQVEAADLVWDRHCGDDAGSDYVDALRACVQRLGERARAIVQWRYGEHRGRGEVARSLGMTPDGVKTALRRIRASLKQCIERRLS